MPGQWDVVMSSKELPDRDMETLKFVVNKIYAIVSKKEIVKVSRVILLKINEPFVTEIEQFLSITHNPKEFFNCEIDELKIKHAHIIVSPVKDEAKILVNAATFNELVNRITRLKNELAQRNLVLSEARLTHHNAQQPQSTTFEIKVFTRKNLKNQINVFLSGSCPKIAN